MSLVSEEGSPANVFDSYMSRMNAGNNLREAFGRRDGRADAFALYQLQQWQKIGNAVTETRPLEERVTPRHAYIIRSLKRPEEVATLRTIYGDGLIVLAAHSPRQPRSDRLTREIAQSDSSYAAPGSYRPDAERLIARDER